jgi:hypothetical protein
LGEVAARDDEGQWKRRKRNIDLFDDMPGGHDERPVVEGRMEGEVGVLCGGVRGIHSVLEAMDDAMRRVFVGKPSPTFYL